MRGRKFKRQKNTTGGIKANSKHPLYSVYVGIKGRCYCKKVNRYENYGGRGIKMCREWKNSFLAFYEWAINNGWKQGLQIDRINNNKGYNPSNCRWATLQEQSRNRKNAFMITYKGETKHIIEWSEIFGIDANRIRERILSSNWSVERTLLTPVAAWRKLTNQDELDVFEMAKNGVPKSKIAAAFNVHRKTIWIILNKTHTVNLYRSAKTGKG